MWRKAIRVTLLTLTLLITMDGLGFPTDHPPFLPAPVGVALADDDPATPGSRRPDQDDDPAYREAIERLQNCRMNAFLARTHLVFGEWLRRESRGSEARDELRTAHALLSGMGAEPFAARAARELRATGERARKRTSQPSDALTAQELTIARLVATGATSREVGEQLFLSPRTIEAHLRNIFRKLGIETRTELAREMLNLPSSTEPAEIPAPSVS